MAGPAMNKGALKHQRDQLVVYERFLPSLDLKRQQLLTELRAAKEALTTGERELDAFQVTLGGLMALVGSSGLDLSQLVRVHRLDIGEENRLGVRLPVLGAVECRTADYSTLAMPFWVDALAAALGKAAAVRLAQQVRAERVRRLSAAVRKTTQRVNLFEKVLIPTARENIRRITVFLADGERAAVVRSKIAKARHAAGGQ